VLEQRSRTLPIYPNVRSSDKYIKTYISRDECNAKRALYSLKNDAINIYEQLFSSQNRGKNAARDTLKMASYTSTTWYGRPIEINSCIVPYNPCSL
jgi:hypothetical protein